MSDSESNDRQDSYKSLTFCSWMGQHSWKEWKQQARSVATKKEIAFIPKVAQFIFDTIKKESDPARALNRAIFNQNWVLKTSIKVYDDMFWQQRFENNDLFIMINDEKCVGLRKLMG
eukprot:1602519-Rhodomonas_salina.1